jgi:DNA-binding CsgD family transcriptional regulator
LKTIVLTVFLALAGQFAFSITHVDSLYKRLDKVMDNRQLYMANKEEKIQAIKQLLSIGNLSPQQTYDINLKLCYEYKKYKSDSAVFYILKNVQIAKDLGSQYMRHKAEIELAWLYSTEGLYIESKNLLDNINRIALDPKLLPDYYECYNEFCSHYGQSNNNNLYYTKSELYRDSLLMVLDPGSLKYQITHAENMFFKGKRKDAEVALLSLLDKTTDKDPERAVIAYLLGRMYMNDENSDLQKQYFAISAITDVENSIKDNASLQSLALTFYKAGDIDQAFRFIEAAVSDALFCNVRYRTVEGSSFYPIINASFQEKEKKQKMEFRLYLILISILSLFLIAGIIYTYKQMKRVSKIRGELFRTNEQLSKLNNELQQANDNLSESNHIKEEYIAHFFDLCSTYIDKLENYRKSLHKKAANNQLDELFKTLKSTSIVETELEELYKNFDTIFLNLYPTFVRDFNVLLVTEERIHPRHGELLNTELRIFALIRLGITDSVKIASFLRYSLRTVYNYRTKVRNKAVSRDSFEEMVKEIGTLKRD